MFLGDLGVAFRVYVGGLQGPADAYAVVIALLYFFCGRRKRSWDASTES